MLKISTLMIATTATPTTPSVLMVVIVVMVVAVAMVVLAPPGQLPTSHPAAPYPATEPQEQLLLVIMNMAMALLVVLLLCLVEFEWVLFYFIMRLGFVSCGKVVHGFGALYVFDLFWIYQMEIG